MDTMIVEFTMDRYPQVHALWEATEGVGLHDDCDSPEGIQAYLGRNPGMSFVALDGEAVVGAVLCGHDGRRGYLHHLAVAPSHRRRRIGRELTDACLAALRSLGIRKCHLFIFSDNSDGLAFWRAVGWSQRSDVSIVSKVIDRL